MSTMEFLKGLQTFSLDRVTQDAIGPGPVPTWSASALKVFEKCPYRTFLRRVQKIPEPSGPAAERGSFVHDMCEQYVRGQTDALTSEEYFDGKRGEVKHFHPELLKLREFFLANPDKVFMEEDWGFTAEWEPTGWMADDVWCRIKVDAMVMESPTSALIIDYKTGRKFGNEISHADQAQIYCIAAFKKFPELEFIRAEFWYLDEGHKLEKSYSRDEIALFEKRVNDRAFRMTTATQFPAHPSHRNCKFCHYKNSGDCEFAITE